MELAWNPAPTLVNLTELRQNIRTGAFAVPENYRQVPPAQQNVAQLVVNLVPQEHLAIITGNKRGLVGTSITDVAAAFAVALALARISKNPQALIFDLIIAIFVGYTVARDWTDTYNLIHAASMWREFEIDGRAADNRTPEGVRAAWVATCNMNSTALHWLAHLVVESAPAGGFLASLRVLKGTIFNPLPLGANGQAVSEQARIMRETNVSLTLADREALNTFRGLSPTLIQALDIMFGEVGLTLQQAADAAEQLEVVEF